jgi:cytochrome c oxidase subunit II
MIWRLVQALLSLSAIAVISGCAGIQSSLDPAGIEAHEVANLFWTVTLVSIAVTVLVSSFIALSIYGPSSIRQRIATHGTIISLGIALPIFVLSGLLIYGLVLMQAGQARSGIAENEVTITGKQWWWRVVYHLPDGREIVSANELRLPVGEPVAIRLETEDVIHSFWAPRLGGKLDMIPGRTNILTVMAQEPGVSRAQCAEYCGGAHALMSMFVVAMPPDEYQAWLFKEAAPAEKPNTEIERLGQEVFFDFGCGACHTVRGTIALGVAGPDLTHVGSRRSLGAATLPNTPPAFASWIADNQHVKPQNFMPQFAFLSDDELQAISIYLDGLE